MMTLEDIYNQLSFGELRMLFLSGAEIDDPMAGMSQESFIKLLPTVELALTELYKRFNLREDNFFVDLQPDQSTYTLTMDYAQSNTRSRQPVQYIDDTAIPFTDNLLKVERVYGTYQNQPYEIALNELDNPASIKTTDYRTLVLPTDKDKAPWLNETNKVQVFYRANHPKISKHLAQASPMTIPIHLPPMYLEALCFYIASRLHNPLGMTPGAMHEGNNYYQRFLEAINVLKQENYEIDRDDFNSKLHERGFA